MDVLKYSYLNGNKFGELNSKDIDLLIEADMQAIHQAYESRHGPEGQPTAVLTGLGWTLVGSHMTESSSCHVNNFVQQQIEPGIDARSIQTALQS